MSPSYAGELTHSFVNPDFGGSPLNGSYLLSNASAQNDHTTKSTAQASSTTTTRVKKQTDAERFQEMVNSLVLSSLANRLVNQAFGPSGLPDNGTINTGLNTISVNAVEGGTQITITDNKTGGRSVIFIPSL